MRIRWGTLLALPLLLAVLAACDHPVVGEAVGVREAGQPLNSSALGDLRTLDPCGLPAPGTFAAYGAAHQLARESFDECRFAVTVGSENVVVYLGMLRPAAALPEGGRTVAALPGRTRVVRTSADGDLPCESHLLLEDNIAVSVVADAQLSESELDFGTVCGIARAGAEGIHQTMSSGQVRHWNPPANSFARLSACALLAAPDVAARVEASTADVTLYPAEHQCTWGVAGGEHSNAQLDLVVGKPLDPSAGSVENIGGRRTLVELTETQTVRVCTLFTEHAPFADAVEDERELAVVRVLHPADTGKDPCSTGRELAGAAWPKLPAAP
ncbi:hypothetical protein FHU38_001252 [Saccharomonospora amisosensis]|uniref:DUF3558 domain-containing protein n=1 Tax=Saccharomonospora amisosensis TaxID=1128677 RepID=A0A7X5UMS9_9PSEU|nr:hypothetical protein [Saccharomonospora amisosensis]NIJ10908.1 hypothetical protein [Saccharomonospora amisosensis]